jgi:hypothetical protein
LHHLFQVASYNDLQLIKEKGARLFSVQRAQLVADNGSNSVANNGSNNVANNDSVAPSSFEHQSFELLATCSRRAYHFLYKTECSERNMLNTLLKMPRADIDPLRVQVYSNALDIQPCRANTSGIACFHFYQVNVNDLLGVLADSGANTCCTKIATTINIGMANILSVDALRKAEKKNSICLVACPMMQSLFGDVLKKQSTSTEETTMSTDEPVDFWFLIHSLGNGGESNDSAPFQLGKQMPFAKMLRQSAIKKACYSRVRVKFSSRDDMDQFLSRLLISLPGNRAVQMDKWLCVQVNNVQELNVFKKVKRGIVCVNDE